MAEPKKKLSKTRTHSRRAGFKATSISLAACSHCGAQIRSHRVCPNCGYYKNAKVAA